MKFLPIAKKESMAKVTFILVNLMKSHKNQINEIM